MERGRHNEAAVEKTDQCRARAPWTELSKQHGHSGVFPRQSSTDRQRFLDGRLQETR